MSWFSSYTNFTQKTMLIIHAWLPENPLQISVRVQLLAEVLSNDRVIATQISRVRGIFPRVALDWKSWCGCGERWRCLMFTGGREQERQECGSWRSEFDWFHHPLAGHQHQSPGNQSRHQDEMRDSYTEYKKRGKMSIKYHSWWMRPAWNCQS